MEGHIIIMSEFSDSLIYYAKQIANDNRYRYYNANQGESNLGEYTFDCATFNSYCIYLAMGWDDFPNSAHGSIGYFWPYISQNGYDSFLLINGFIKYPFNENLLTEGSIIITNENLHHSLFYIGNNQICDANNYFGYGDDSIAIRNYPTYDISNFAYIYLPPDTPVPPIPIITDIYPHPRTRRKYLKMKKR